MTEIFIKHSDLKLNNGQVLIDRPDLKDEFLVFTHNKKLRVISSFCPHLGGPLKYLGNKFSCHFHGYEFDPNSLKCTNRNLSARVMEYSVTGTNDGIIIEVED